MAKPFRRQPEAPKPLSNEEIAHNRGIVHSHMPEFVPFIQELYNLGMIEGWRAVKHAEVTTNNTDDN